MDCLNRELWRNLAKKIVERMQENRGVEAFITKRNAFENWIQVEVVRYLLEEGMNIEKVTIEPRLSNYKCEMYADIQCESETIELKMFSKKLNHHKIKMACGRKPSHVVIFVFNNEDNIPQEFELIYKKDDVGNHNYAVYLWSSDKGVTESSLHD